MYTMECLHLRLCIVCVFPLSAVSAQSKLVCCGADYSMFFSNVYKGRAGTDVTIICYFNRKQTGGGWYCDLGLSIRLLLIDECLDTS